MMGADSDTRTPLIYSQCHLQEYTIIKNVHFFTLFYTGVLAILTILLKHFAHSILLILQITFRRNILLSPSTPSAFDLFSSLKQKHNIHCLITLGNHFFMKGLFHRNL